MLFSQIPFICMSEHLIPGVRDAGTTLRLALFSREDSKLKAQGHPSYTVSSRLAWFTTEP